MIVSVHFQVYLDFKLVQSFKQGLSETLSYLNSKGTLRATNMAPAEGLESETKFFIQSSSDSEKNVELEEKVERKESDQILDAIGSRI